MRTAGTDPGDSAAVGFGVALAWPLALLLAGMAVTVGFNSETAFPFSSRWALNIGVGLFLLVPGAASLAPRLLRNDAQGRLVMAIVGLFAAVAVLLRYAADLAAIPVDPANLLVAAWVAIWVGLGIYVGARVGAPAVGRAWVSIVAAAAVFFVFAVIALAPVLGLM